MVCAVARARTTTDYWPGKQAGDPSLLQPGWMSKRLGWPGKKALQDTGQLLLGGLAIIGDGATRVCPPEPRPRGRFDIKPFAQDAHHSNKQQIQRPHQHQQPGQTTTIHSIQLARRLAKLAGTMATFLAYRAIVGHRR